MQPAISVITRGKIPRQKRFPKKYATDGMKYPKVFEIFMTNFIMAGSILRLNPMGLASVEDLFFLDDMDWGILEEIDVSSLPFSLKDSIPFFSNGMGAYACFDLKSKDKQRGFIWYHDKAPRLDIELWAVIDEWTKIGIER